LSDVEVTERATSAARVAGGWSEVKRATALKIGVFGVDDTTAAGLTRGVVVKQTALGKRSDNTGDCVAGLGQWIIGSSGLGTRTTDLSDL